VQCFPLDLCLHHYFVPVELRQIVKCFISRQAKKFFFWRYVPSLISLRRDFPQPSKFLRFNNVLFSNNLSLSFLDCII
jgi:hypothetical protein